MNNATKSNRYSPEKTILRVLMSEMKRDLILSRRKDTLVTMVRSLSQLFRDLGIPQKWMTKIKFSPVAIKKQKRESKTIIPKKAAELVEALIELVNAEQSSELAFWASEALAEINAVLDGNLIRYLKNKERDNQVSEVVSLASKTLESVLTAGETDSVRAVLYFWRKVSSNEALFQSELQSIKKRSLTILPEQARRFLSPDQDSEVISPGQISDPSQTVEIRQFAHLMQSIWIRHHQGRLDVSTYESLLAFGKGFKNLEFVGTFGEGTRFSDEYYQDSQMRAGEACIIEVPPIIWKFGDRVRVIVKGKVKSKSQQRD